ncbi:NYN domain-containing protein, partial [Patescibacteria group bacterium]|nr:NYN domain-containing protein [Patescibacteria group bacterium]
IDIDKLRDFSSLFSTHTRCYYGKDPKNKGSVNFNYVLKRIFGKNNFISKDLQKIKHYIEKEEKEPEKLFQTDSNGKDYIEIRKCNFDVEISVDAIKKINQYDTFCLFSGDADFVYLNNFLRKRGKNVILIKGGYITTKLKKSADLIVNAQRVKKYIAKIKQRPN